VSFGELLTTENGNIEEDHSVGRLEMLKTSLVTLMDASVVHVIPVPVYLVRDWSNDNIIVGCAHAL
jgi:hypothetical protein